ncbi:MAG: NYN domain-containing protein [Anaerolineales bacterium]|nr:NYN domain-containing protein [Anaerolineales bacterium]
MPYLIDGHNLIPKIPGLSLESINDEMDLVEMLQEFCHRRQKQVEVFFDNAPAGQPRARNFGKVIARFVPPPRTADQAIHNKLSHLGAAARNWIIVSSDHAVQSYARAARAQTMSSEAFAQLMRESLIDDPMENKIRTEPAISEAEIDEWMELFNHQADENEA